MSALSSIANILANSGLTSGKNDDAKPVEASFLALLSGKGSSGFLGADQHTMQSLVELLDKPEDMQPPAAAVQPTAQIVVDNPRNAHTDRKPEAVQDKPREDATASAKNDAPAPAKNDAPAVQENASEEVEPAANINDATDALAEKLREKGAQLSDLLAAMASLLGTGQGVVHIQTVQFTQTTITNTGNNNLAQAGFGMSQPFTDLSNQFQQLIASLSASQNLPSETGTPLNMTFRSFQALFASLAGDAQDGALPDFNAQFMAGCKSCATQLTLATQSFTFSAQDMTVLEGNNTSAGLSDALHKLQQWLGDFQAMAKDANAAAAHANAATLSMASDGTKTLEAAALNDNLPVVAPTATNTTTANAAIQSALQNSANTGTNLSGGNSGNNGQGTQSQAAPVGSATGVSAATLAANTQATSFAKTLQAAATHRPVLDQVAFHIKTFAKTGDSKIDITLEPAELGKLHVKMSINGDGNAVVSITADNKSTLDLLQRDARGLEQALAEAGIKAESGSLSFNLRGGDQNQQDGTKQAWSGYSAAPLEEEALAPLAVMSRDYVLTVKDGLNIKI